MVKMINLNSRKTTIASVLSAIRISGQFVSPRLSIYASNTFFNLARKRTSAFCVWEQPKYSDIREEMTSGNIVIRNTLLFITGISRWISLTLASF